MSFVAIKIALEYVPPIALGFIRFLIASLVMSLFIRKFIKYEKKDILYILLTAFLGITSYFIFENVALIYTTATNASLIAATVPIFYLIFFDFTSKKVSNKLNYFGSILGLTGVSILILNGKFILKLNPLGDILMFGAVISWVFYTFTIQRLEKYDNMVVSRDIILFGTLMFIPFVLLEIILNFGKVYNETLLNVFAITSILYLAVFSSAIAYLFWNKAIRLSGPKTVTNGIYYIPIVSIIADSLILKNIPNIYSIFGAIMVLMGIYIAEKGNKLKLKA
ncbi:DMT family transporter [Methanococcus vannielii]|uniref:DMT family transporter n=1 Tax=Methanococcus vannielii TaxID=2187 RepID=UPI0022B29DFF|nr:DMT family transporter [Methanococcus vannielii]